jgi:hypothetical protein
MVIRFLKSSRAKLNTGINWVIEKEWKAKKSD